MGRPRSFDADAVLDKAAQTFRAKGFEGTSIDDLERATGLRRASLYGAYGDKRALYLASLKRYEGERSESFSTTLCAGKEGRAAIECLFRTVVAEAADDPCGCLIANAASDQGSRDAKVARCIEENRRRMEDAILTAVTRGRKDGSVSARGDVRARARFLFAAMLGIRALAKTGCGRAELQAVADEALRTLD
jgi:TetR/AcrR family transcriptional repressor of nem operon